MSSVRSAPLLSIGELARRVGAAPSALRYWERAGLLSPEWEGGRRRYGPEAVRRVGVIRMCQEGGFGIGEIRELLGSDPEGGGLWRERVEGKLAEVRAEIERLQASAEGLAHVLACPEPTLSGCPTFAAFVRYKAEGGEPPEALPAGSAARPGPGAGRPRGQVGR